MAMNFFEHQQKARRRSGLLVLLFISGVAALIASTYIVGLIIAAVAAGGAPEDAATHTGLFAVSVLVSLLIVGLGWLIKRAQLASGGRAVAEALGGRIIEPSTLDPQERRVLNVVEEMAIASGVPVPPVYIVPDRSINAFAAGYRPEQAVIGITRGALQAFNREQLQGVIAHEFSHILNGDMRLNIRLVSAIFGLACLSLVGSVIVRSLLHGSRGVRIGSGRGGRGGGGGAVIIAIVLAGVGLMIIGWIGRIFGMLIQAAVSRQREFLADASAVQFTRNPAGIAGALRVIAGVRSNSMEQEAAAEYRHLFFTSAVESWLASHPPLAERIARIEKRPAHQVAAELAAGRSTSPRRAGGIEAAPAAAGIAGSTTATRRMDATAAPAARLAQVEIDARPPETLLGSFASPTRTRGDLAHAAEEIGAIEPASIDYARAVRARLPTSLLAAAHEPYDARGVVAALLLSEDESIAARQIQTLRRPGLEGLPELTRRLAGTVRALPRDLRLPLVDLCVPSLRRLSPAQAEALLAAVRALIATDQRLTLFEWAVRAILRRAFGAERGPGAGSQRLASLRPAVTQFLATLAWSGARDEPAASAAFMSGHIAAGITAPRLPARSACTLDALDASLKHLALLQPRDRDRLVAGAVACVASDEVITITEAEVLRAAIALLGAPMPPVLPLSAAAPAPAGVGA